MKNAWSKLALIVAVVATTAATPVNINKSSMAPTAASVATPSVKVAAGYSEGGGT